MTTTAAAIYEHGVLRPLSPLPLPEGARVDVTVTDEVSSLPMDSNGTASVRTGAELARIWSALPHLSDEEAAEFERDVAASDDDRPDTPLSTGLV